MKKLKDINWNQVYYFYEVARKLSMKEAAEILGVSAPTVSEQIKKLESLLGVELFKRYTRKIVLTPDGKVLFNFAEDMFNSGTRFLDAVSPISIGGYPARVGIQETMSTKLPMDLLLKYSRLYTPFGSLNTYREYNSENLEYKIINNDLDWAISLEEPKFREIESQKIGEAKIVFCASKKVFASTSKKNALFTILPLARSSWDDILNKKVKDHLIKNNIKVEEFFESDHREFCINMTEMGVCLSTFSIDEVKDASWGKNVKTFTMGDPIRLSYYAIWPKSKRRMIAIKKLREII